MKTIATLILLALLTGCAQDNIKQGLDNLSKDCDRHYTFSASTGGVGGIGGSLTVAGTADCKAEHTTTPAATAAPAGQ